MNKFVFSLACACAAGVAQADTLYNNGPVTVDGLSVLRSGSTTLGWTVSSATSFSLADDFTVSASSWDVSGFSVYAYQTNATAFTFTQVAWSIVSGDVNAGTVVASGTQAPTDGGLMGYRVTGTTLTSTARPIFKIDVDTPDFSLPSGSYYLRWMVTGSTSFSGPYVPTVAGTATGNGLQSGSGAAYAALVESDGAGAELPFTVYGTAAAVSEPASMALLLSGLAVVGASRRRRSPSA